MQSQSSHAATPQNLKSLTAMRFFAAMWVVVFDFWPDLGLPTPRIVAKGYLGVDLFFVLSGFILSHVYLRAFGERRFSYAGFLQARLARIYPVHLVTLVGIGLLATVAALAGVGTGDKALIWSSLPAQITLTQAWGLGPQGGWNHPAWSISAEWFAYLAFPAFAWAAWRLRTRPWLALALALFLMIAVETGFERLAGFSLTRATTSWGALRILPCFTLGCAVYLAWSSHPIRTSRAAMTLAAAAVGLIALSAQLAAPDWISVGLFGGLLFGLASLTTSGSTLLTAPSWVYLGEVSFSIYMVCVPWRLVFGRTVHGLPALSVGAPAIATCLVGALGTIPAGMLLHHLIERPARRLMLGRRVPFAWGRRLGAIAIAPLATSARLIPGDPSF